MKAKRHVTKLINFFTSSKFPSWRNRRSEKQTDSGQTDS